jgi:hypothetical protein
MECDTEMKMNNERLHATAWMTLINPILSKKKPGTKEYIQYNSIYVKAENRQKFCAVRSLVSGKFFC